MSKRLLIGISILVVCLGVGFLFFQSSKQNSSKDFFITKTNSLDEHDTHHHGHEHHSHKISSGVRVKYKVLNISGSEVELRAKVIFKYPLTSLELAWEFEEGVSQISGDSALGFDEQDLKGLRKVKIKGSFNFENQDRVKLKLRVKGSSNEGVSFNFSKPFRYKKYLQKQMPNAVQGFGVQEKAEPKNEHGDDPFSRGNSLSNGSGDEKETIIY